MVVYNKIIYKKIEILENVLLILAGISIAQLTGNGLFENAKLAKQKTEQKQDEENQTLGEYINKINKYITGNIDSSREEVSAKKGKWEILASTTSTTETEYTVKDLKQFSEIAVVVWSSDKILSSTPISYQLFSESSLVYAGYYNGQPIIGLGSYINDTTVKLYCAYSSATKVDLYGIY